MQILNAKAAAAKVGLSLRTFYSEVSAGRFPKPLQLTTRRVGWVEQDIEKWLTNKIARRDAGQV